jgi:uncharacterized membrane protein YtjA (UPF0391 family)
MIKNSNIIGVSKFLLFSKKGVSMLGIVITFLILAIVAGMLGFTGVEIISIQLAKILFVVFLVLFVLSFFFYRRNGVDRL